MKKKRRGCDITDNIATKKVATNEFGTFGLSREEKASNSTGSFFVKRLNDITTTL